MSKKILINKLQELLDTGELLDIIDECYSVTCVINKLELTTGGRNTAYARDFLLLNDIDICHFTPNGKSPPKIVVKNCIFCEKPFETVKRNSREVVSCSRACSNKYFRSGINSGNYTDGSCSYRKKALRYLDNICKDCGISDERVLEVHHVDKDRTNNDISNLVVLCANCHLIEHGKTKS